MPKRADYMPKESASSRIFAGDKVMWVVIITLLVYSIFAVYSNMAYEAASKANQKLIMHLLFICIGMTGFFVARMFSINFYKKMTIPFYIFSLGATLLMIVLNKGTGAARGLDLKFFTFQPFELLKFATVMLLARQLSTRQKRMNKISIIPSFRPKEWKKNRQKQIDILMDHTIPILGPIAICCAITMIFSNSTTLIIALSCLAMMYLSRVHLKDLLKICFIGAVVGLSAIGIYKAVDASHRGDTAVSRIEGWTPDVITKSVELGKKDSLEYYKRHDNEHDQTLYSKLSVASGGLVGKGPGQSANRSLSESDTDMVFAFIIEEYGLLFGGLVVIFAFLLMFYRSMEIFLKCGMAFPGLMVLGIGTTIVLQAFLHMLVSVSLFPLTGQQLPIISNGGTSLLVTLTMLGVLMSVSAKAEQEEMEQKLKEQKQLSAQNKEN